MQQVSVSNFCAASANAANEFTDLKSCVVISNGNISDCTDIDAAIQSQNRLSSNNNNINILYVDVAEFQIT
jgi:hypothetical protein